MTMRGGCSDFAVPAANWVFHNRAVAGIDTLAVANWRLLGGKD